MQICPFVRTDAEGNLVGVSKPVGGTIASRIGSRDVLSSAGKSVVATHSADTLTGSDEQVSGTLAGTEQFDAVPFDLTAGTTYSFALRGTATDGIEDPYLIFFAPDGSYITENDDGGAGRSSLITFTAAQTGTYYVGAASWYTLAYGDPTLDTGGYTVDMWAANPAQDVGSALNTAAAIEPGTVFGHFEIANDVDTYRVDMTAGLFYDIDYAGNTTGATVELINASGVVIASSDPATEGGFGYFAQQSGTYYVRVSVYDPDVPGKAPSTPVTGGYTLDVAEIDPADGDPLASINWESAENVPFVDVNGVPTAYVYFADAGENFGETNDHGGPMRTWGWNEYEMQQVMLALEEYEHILGVNYEITTDPEQATFRLMTTRSDLYGAYAYPQDPAYGEQAGILVFNTESGGWSFDQQQSLERGGYSFAVILHEFGHAHGLAHPHDDGGGSEVMLGVDVYTDLGIYDLNQGVYTVMTYNDAWQTSPDGPSTYNGANIDNGWSATLSAFDIAALQLRYGVHDYNTGNNVYELAGVEDEAFYQTIWDTGGTDTISFDGAADTRIDLLAATLDYSPTGGGVVSFVSGIHGGYTIANGVVIENATGGSGDDVLIGNSASNALTGNAGDDMLMGRTGNDTLNGGAGSDTASYASAGGAVTVNLLKGTVKGADGSDILISIENLIGSAYNDSLTGSAGANILNGGAGNDTLAGGKGVDTYVFADAGVDTITGYERGEDIDLSAFGITIDQVDIRSDRIVVDLAGDQDLTIMFNTRGFSENDLYFG